jgi:Family of unknown function (DUF6502)
VKRRPQPPTTIPRHPFCMLPRHLKSPFAAALRRLLRPAVRQMIAVGLTYPTFAQIMKQLFVEVAQEDFALPFKRQTDSRLALVTGISRKEISQLRRRRRGAAGTPEVEESIVTHVIGRWMAGPPYATPDGIPRRLRYESAERNAVTFARLVRELGADIPVRAVLDELLHIGSAVLRADGDVELRREVHIPAADSEGKLVLLGSDTAELFSTIMHNIEDGEAPWLQRKVVYDNIGGDALPVLQEEARHAGLDFIRRANALLASYDRDRHPDAPAGRRSRVVVGVYYFEEPVALPELPDDEPTADAPSSRPAPGRIRRKS